MITIRSRGGEEVEIKQEWIDEWSKIYYDVPATLLKIRSWCLDNPQKAKTRIRAFVGNWIRRDCRLRPQPERQSVSIQASRVSAEPLEVRKSRLAELRGALRKEAA